MRSVIVALVVFACLACASTREKTAEEISDSVLKAPKREKCKSPRDRDAFCEVIIIRRGI